MVLVQKWPFFQIFFLGNIGQENVFYDILKQKNAFVAYKNKKLKNSRNWHFFKEVFQTGFPKLVLVQKWPFFQLFFFGNRFLDNVFYNILKVKNAFLGYRKKKFKNSKNWHFSKEVNPWFWPKNGHFFNFFFRQYRPGKCLLWYSRAKKRLSRL